MKNDIEESYETGYRVIGLKDMSKGTLTVTVPSFPLVRLELDMFREEPDKATAEAFEWLVFNLPEVLNSILNASEDETTYVEMPDMDGEIK